MNTFSVFYARYLCVTLRFFIFYGMGEKRVDVLAEGKRLPRQWKRR